MNCTMEACENTLGPNSLEIKHNGELVGFVCDVCQGTAKGMKLFLKKGESGNFEIEQVTPIAKPL